MPASVEAGFVWVDYVVFGLFLLLSVGVGIYHAYKSWARTEELEDTQGDVAATDEYLMGGRKMPVIPVALSLLTTFLSGITMLGTPAEIFQKGLLFWIYYLTGAVAFLISGLFFLPVFYKLRPTSIYAYFEHRFGSRLLRRMCASVFLINTVFYMSVVLYAPAVALAGVTDIPTWPYILIIGSTCTLYTTIGGLKAVVWTDTIQAFFMYLGLGIAIVKGTIDAGGIGRVFEVAVEGGRVADLAHFNPNPAQYNSVWVSTVGAFSFWMSLYGLNQMAIQRYCSLPSLADARKVVLITVPAFMLLGTMACFIGLVVLAYFYNCNPMETKKITTQDQLVIRFANEVLSFLPGLSGLFLACIFSSTLSTVSSGMNSMAAVAYEDFLRRRLHLHITDAQATMLNKGLVLMFGTLATGMAFAAGPLGGIIKASISMMGTLAGPLVGLFFLAVFVPKASKTGALVGFLVAAVITLSICLWNFLADPYKYNYLPTNTSEWGCGPGVTFEIREDVSVTRNYDPHYGDPNVFWLARWSSYLFPLVGIFLVFLIGVPVSYCFPPGDEGYSYSRKFSLTFAGRKVGADFVGEDNYDRGPRRSIQHSPKKHLDSVNENSDKNNHGKTNIAYVTDTAL